MSIIAKPLAVIALAIIFIGDLFVSSIRVAAVVLGPGPRTRPAILVMDIALERPGSVALLAYLTSLTPGSTCLHVSHDRRRLYLHVLDAPDPAATIMRFRHLYERWVKVLDR